MDNITDTHVGNKIVILVEENPQVGTFEATCNAMGLYKSNLGCIDPIDYLAKESHALGSIYKDVFTTDLANELMGYLISKHPQDLVYDVIDGIFSSKEQLILINSTLLKQEEVDFILTIMEGHSRVMSYTLTGAVEKDARQMYDASKHHRDVHAIY